MSLLKRIGATSGTTGQLPGTPATPAAPARLGTPPAQRREEDNSVIELRQRVQQRLINELDPKLDLSNVARVRQQVEEIFNTILDSENIVLSRSERARLFESIAADILGFGPLQELLNDPEISEIMVNGPKKVYVEKRGKIQLTDVTFVDEQHVLRVIDRIDRKSVV